ncbi:hypothetical protein A9Q84_18740 [Halobacteriovorax marinus]|uniref:Uncharacterized protein n=1 Tax=Halobacteriovorax marinus TaxID=97084 RepID=A0A1Y5F256_9BACT|nr:hypothetical protein A9Q84_18740 [Halobacteriovorax marinus]
MGARKDKLKPTIEKPIDIYNYSGKDSDMPVLEILNERIRRSFQLSLSTHLRVSTNLTFTQEKYQFKDWLTENTQTNCMFIITLQSVNAPILLKFDRNFSYGVIDILTGGTGRDYRAGSDKEMTTLELSLLKDLGCKFIEDLNTSRTSVQEIKANFLKIEENPQFVGIVSPDSRIINVKYEVEYGGNTGMIEVLYPYSTLFPLKDKLFSKHT